MFYHVSISSFKKCLMKHCLSALHIFFYMSAATQKVTDMLDHITQKTRAG